VADNVVLNAGTGGASMAADDIGGIHYQRVKVTYGADGAAADVTAAVGLPVTSATGATFLLAANSGVDVGDVTINNAAGAASVPVQGAAAHDAAYAGNPLQIGGYASAAAPTNVSGDGDAVRAWFDLAGRLQVGDGGGSLTVDGTVTAAQSTAANLNATVVGTGTFAVQAAQSGTWNVTNISGTVSLPTGAATAAKQPALGTAGTSSADVLTVQGRAAMTPLLVDGSGATQPVSGTVAVTNAGLTALNGAIAGTEVQVDVLTLPTVTVNAHAVTNAGTFAVQVDGAALTALQLIDDAVFTDDAAFTPGTSKGFAVGFQADETSPDSVNEGDFGVPRMSLERFLVVTDRPTATGEGYSVYKTLDLDESEEEVKASAGKIYGYFFTNQTSSTRYIKFYDNTAAGTTVGTTTPLFTIPLEADQAAHIEWGKGIPCATGICIAATTGLADNDTGAPGAADVVGFVLYK
jgi:hypothetical protein